MAARLSNKKIIEALETTKGTIYLAAKLLHCSPHTIYKRAENFVEVKEAIENHRGETVDTAELALRNAVLNGEPWAISLTLKTLGKDRGYVERYQEEHSGPGGGPVQVTSLSDQDLLEEAAKILSKKKTEVNTT